MLKPARTAMNPVTNPGVPPQLVASGLGKMAFVGLSRGSASTPALENTSAPTGNNPMKCCSR